MNMGAMTLAAIFGPRVLAVGLLCLAAEAMAVPAAAGSDTPIDRAALVGKLVPVTGDPIRSVDLTVPFAKSSAKLTAFAREQLDELGAALAGEKLRGFQVGVYGHTDASGPAAYNRKLSEQRAEAVVGYLVEKSRLARARFRHGGFGEERLLEGMDPNSPRHRRVEVVVYGPPGGSPADGGGSTGEKDHEKTGDGKDESGLQAIQ